MWTTERSGRRLLGALAAAAVALAGLAALALSPAGPVWAQSASRDAYMGVQLQDLGGELRDSYGYRGPGGVLISGVESGSPADKAGIRRGDILIRLDGKTVDSAADLVAAVRGRSAGDNVNLSVWRDGREVPLRLALGERREVVRERRVVREYGEEAPKAPKPPKAPKAPKRMELRWHGDDGEEHIVIPMPDADEIQRHMEMFTARPRLGVQLQDLSPELGAYFERPDGRGVLVTSVIEDTPAENAGLKAGDVIIELDGEGVDDAAELREELAEKEAGPVRVTVLRKGQRQTFTAELEERFAMSWTPGEGSRRMVIRGLGPEEQKELRRELQKSMEELKREMAELKRELKDMEKDLKEEQRGD